MVASTLIEASVFNALTADVATGLSTCITKDGQTVVTANIPLGGFKLTGLAAGTAAGNSLRYEQLYTAVTANIPMAGFKLTGLGAGSAAGDSVRWEQLGIAVQNSQSAAYTTVLTDAGKHILHPTADNNPRTFTIDSNANVAYTIGTMITFVNQINVLTIAITSDTMTLAGTATTGSRTLAVNGVATALKVSSTGWIISGSGLA